MDAATRERYAQTYRDGLLEDVLPFWVRHAIDREHGGFCTSLDRDGSVIDTDKAIWQQGRFAWLLATLHQELEPRQEWIDLAVNGLRFLERHGFAEDGRMLFLVTREGRPLRRRRYAYSEAFASLAYAACSRATGKAEWARRARELFEAFTRFSFTPGLLPAKTDPLTRPMKSIGPLMIALNVAQVLRDTIAFEQADEWIDRLIGEIQRDFVHPELQAVLEVVDPDGGVIDHFDGRTLNPGHALEAAWFILFESRRRGADPELLRLGTQMLDWMWARGWDQEYGGLFYFRDLHGRPVQEYWHDMKFWWPHAEAILATLLAWTLTGEERYADRHREVHDWTHAHFPDRQHGEWFGYLHRDGRLSSPVKGNYWKGPFHVPRMQLLASGLLGAPLP